MTEAILAGVVVLVCCLVAFGPVVLAIEGDAPTEVVLGAIAWTIFALTVAVVLVGQATAKQEHAWSGGSGPETTCHYESRPLLVGKVVVPTQFTVCQ